MRSTSTFNFSNSGPLAHVLMLDLNVRPRFVHFLPDATQRSFLLRLTTNVVILLAFFLTHTLLLLLFTFRCSLALPLGLVPHRNLIVSSRWVPFLRFRARACSLYLFLYPTFRFPLARSVALVLEFFLACLCRPCSSLLFVVWSLMKVSGRQNVCAGRNDECGYDISLVF